MLKNWKVFLLAPTVRAIVLLVVALFCSVTASAGTEPCPIKSARTMTVDELGNFYLFSFNAATNEASVAKCDSQGNWVWSRSPGDGTLSDSQLAVAPDYSLYITKAGRVAKFDENGKSLGELGKGIPPCGANGKLCIPTSVAVAKDGMVYVYDISTGNINKYASNGSYLLTFPQKTIVRKDGMGQPTLSTDPQGNVYIVDFQVPRIAKYDPMGRLLADNLNQGTKFYNFTELAIDSDGNLHWEGVRGMVALDVKTGVLSEGKGFKNIGDVDDLAASRDRIYALDSLGHRVSIWTAGGELIAAYPPFKASANTGLVNSKKDSNATALSDVLVAMSIDGAQNIYALTDTNRVVRYDKRGTLLTSWTIASSTGDIKVDSIGNVYVPGNGGIQKYDNTGKLISQLGADQKTNAGFKFQNAPEQIAVDGKGNIYGTQRSSSAASQNGSLVKLNSNGEFQWSWTSTVPEWDQLNKKFKTKMVAGGPIGEIAADDLGNCYVRLPSVNATVKLDSSVKPLAYYVHDSPFVYSHKRFGMSASPNGNVILNVLLMNGPGGIQQIENMDAKFLLTSRWTIATVAKPTDPPFYTAFAMDFMDMIYAYSGTYLPPSAKVVLPAQAVSGGPAATMSGPVQSKVLPQSGGVASTKGSINQAGILSKFELNGKLVEQFPLSGLK